MKQCSKCGEVKPLEAFSKDGRLKDGRRAQCKACDKAYRQTERRKAAQRAANKRYQQSEKGKASKKRYQQTEKGKAAQKRYSQTEAGMAVRKAKKKRYQQTDKYKAAMKRYRANNPEKAKAHYAVNNAIRHGKLTRQPCQVCGSENSEAHHESYAPEHWLYVMWLCRKHHIERHQALEAAA